MKIRAILKENVMCRIDFKFLLPALLILVATGCSRATYSLREQVAPGVEAVVMSAELQSSLTQRESEIQSYRGLSRLQVEYAGERTSVRQVVAFQRPGFVRVETVPLNSAYALNVLVADGSQVTFLDTSNKFAFVGSDSPATVQKLVDVPLEIDALTSVLLGRVPAAHLGTHSATQLFNDPANEELYILNESLGELFVINAKTHLIKEALFRDRFKAALRARIFFSEYIKQDGFDVPGMLQLEIPAKDTVMAYDFVSSAVNKPLPQKVFSVIIPADFTRKKDLPE